MIFFMRELKKINFKVRQLKINVAIIVLTSQHECKMFHIHFPTSHCSFKSKDLIKIAYVLFIYYNIFLPNVE